MRSDIIEMLNTDNDYWIFLRENPYWHQRLSYYPEEIYIFLEEYKKIRRKRFIDKLEDSANMLSMINMLMEGQNDL